MVPQARSYVHICCDQWTLWCLLKPQKLLFCQTYALSRILVIFSPFVLTPLFHSCKVGIWIYIYYSTLMHSLRFWHNFSLCTVENLWSGFIRTSGLFTNFVQKLVHIPIRNSIFIHNFSLIWQETDINAKYIKKKSF